MFHDIGTTMKNSKIVLELNYMEGNIYINIYIFFSIPRSITTSYVGYATNA